MQEKWHFVKLNKKLVKQESEIQKNQSECNHDFWIAKCSCCGKVLASEIQNSTDKDIKTIIINLCHS